MTEFILILFSLLLCFFLLILFLIFPAPRKHPARNALEGATIAHRGLHQREKGLPENSIGAFQNAVAHGYPIEIDIHLTQDGKIAVFHDDNTRRVCGVDHRVEDLTMAELSRLSLDKTGYTVPSLEDCLAAVDGRVFLLIEFKTYQGNSAALCREADRILSAYRGLYLIQSFYPQVLFWYKKNRKEICRGQLAAAFSEETLEKRLLGNMLFNFIGRPDFISYEEADAKKPMRRLVTLLGAFPVGWTYRSPEQLKKTKKDFRAWIFENFRP